MSTSQQVVTFASIPSPVGPLLAGVTNDALCFLEFSDPRRVEMQTSRLKNRLRAEIASGHHPLLDTLLGQLDEYFDGRRRHFDVPLIFPGTPFQVRVWSALRSIPYGQTCSYQALANHVGSPQAVRAVGQANGMNPIAIVIPCHRVINSSGALGGYGGGLPRKQHLLNLERGDVLF
jgi:AraC family transcriptional regulator of adaptative response/methylated-DNA-[protein]-cysteine methyltransferase